MSRRFKLTLAYIGTAYHGWQIQPNRPTVQETVQLALSRFLQHEITLVGSSRTDAGVHALGQVAHFDSQTELSPFRLQKALSAHLPPDISVVSLAVVPASFHAQKQAILKDYTYYFYISPLPYAFWEPYAWGIPYTLDREAMAHAAAALLGKHDFRAFCASDSTAKTFTREVTAIEIRALTALPFLSHSGERPLYAIDVSGKGFLKFMIRNIVGTLVDVGHGKRSPESLKTILTSGDRTQDGPTAPARGLFLKRCYFKDEEA